MLCVPTYVAPSRISGVGLFSARRLPAGCRIWQFTEGVDWRLTQGQLQAFPEPFRSRLDHYVYQEESGAYVLCGDNAKFMNHDERPNCSDSDPTFTVTARLVRVGEELTCDYREFDLPSRLYGASFGETSAALAAARHEPTG
jgi:SET domain-containing protein